MSEGRRVNLSPDHLTQGLSAMIHVSDGGGFERNAPCRHRVYVKTHNRTNITHAVVLSVAGHSTGAPGGWHFQWCCQRLAILPGPKSALTLLQALFAPLLRRPPPRFEILAAGGGPGGHNNSMSCHFHYCRQFRCPRLAPGGALRRLRPLLPPARPAPTTGPWVRPARRIDFGFL